MNEHGLASAAAPTSVPDEALIRDLVCGMLSQDPRRLRATVVRYYAPGAVLYHYMTRAATAVDMYRVYRAYTSGFRSRPVIRDIIIDTKLRNPHQHTEHRHQYGTATGVLTAPGRRGEAMAEAAAAAAGATEQTAVGGGGAGGAGGAAAGRATPVGPTPPPEGCTAAAVWLDQHVTPRYCPLPLPEAIVPTIVFLKFRPCPHTGRPLVYEQYDHISLYSFIWSFGPPSRWIFDHLVTPSVMYGIGAVAYGLDFLEECWRFVRQQLLNESVGDGGSVEKGGGGGSGGQPRGTMRPRGPGGVRVSGAELPGEVDHSATGYGLVGQQLDGSDLARPDLGFAATGRGQAAAAGTGGADSATNRKPMPPAPLR